MSEDEADKTKKLVERLDSLKKIVDTRRDERLRWETELQTLEKTREELEKNIRDELGIDPAQLQAHQETLQSEITALIEEAETLLKQTEEKV